MNSEGKWCWRILLIFSSQQWKDLIKSSNYKTNWELIENGSVYSSF
ncbi:MAG: hypothetical protein IPH62_19855 [Ignavibacteriae bacterium]|nr:hypothetical protein [Ignavibacteriota bacterium]